MVESSQPVWRKTEGVAMHSATHSNYATNMKRQAARESVNNNSTNNKCIPVQKCAFTQRGWFHPQGIYGSSLLTPKLNPSSSFESTSAGLIANNGFNWGTSRYRHKHRASRGLSVELFPRHLCFVSNLVGIAMIADLGRAGRLSL